MKKLIVYFCIITFVYSCKSRKVEPTNTNTQIPTTNTPVETSQYASLVKNLEKKINFEQVRIQSNINAELSQYIPPISANIYIENNKKVWMNLSSLFLPVARGIAEPNSVRGYEKIKRTYIESDYTYLNKLLKVDFINYQNLQNILLGQLIFTIDVTNDTFSKTENGYKIERKEPLIMIIDGEKSINKISQTCNFNNQLTSVKIEGENTKKSFEIQYSNWENIENKAFPRNVKIIINTEKTEQILIENTKFDFYKQETPYTVPNNYTKTIIK